MPAEQHGEEVADLLLRHARLDPAQRLGIGFDHREFSGRRLGGCGGWIRGWRHTREALLICFVCDRKYEISEEPVNRAMRSASRRLAEAIGIR